MPKRPEFYDVSAAHEFGVLEILIRYFDYNSVYMRRGLFSFKVVFLCVLMIFSSSIVSVGAASKGSKCVKVGQTQITKNVSYVCVKSGSKAFWQVKSKIVNGKENLATSTTAAKSQSFIAPTVSSDGSGACEITERSIHRLTYPKGPYVGFPRRPINSFRNTGVLNYALIPVDWADLPGDEKQLKESVEQTNSFKLWMELASQGRVQINWRIHPSWVRMSGVSSSWYTPSAFPANVAFGDAAIAAADREFNFSGIDAVIYYLPGSQGVFIEGSQGSVDTGLERPFQTAEGNVSSFAVIGSYFDQDQKNYWSAWVHYSLIWMGMPELFDARSNRGASERAIPSGNMAGYDIMASQDGPNRQLSGWLRFLLDWFGSDQIYCKKMENVTSVKLSLDPVGDVSTKLKMVGIQISDTKLVVIESRRLDKRFDCSVNTEFKKDGVIVYIVDSTQGHVTGETLSLVSPMNRVLLRSYCNTPTQQNPTMNVGDYVDVLGLRVKVLESGTFDTIEISRL